MIFQTRAFKRTLAVLLVLAILAANLWALLEYPAPYCDEVIFADLGYHLWQDGCPRLTLLDGLLGADQIAQQPMLVYYGALGAWLRVFGTSFLAIRLFAVAGWLAATAIVYLVGKQLYSREAGLLSAAVFSVSLNVFWASHIARPEIWVIAAGMGLLCLYLHLREKPSVGGYILLGALAGLALELHANTIWLSLPVGLIALAENYRTGAGRIRLLAALAAALMAVGLYALIHLLPDPAQGWTQLAFFSGYTRLDGAPLLSRLAAQAEFLRNSYLGAFNGAVSAYTVWALAGIGYSAFRREPGDRLLLAVWLISAATFGLVMQRKASYYGVLWDGYLALFIGAAASRLGVSLAGRFKRVPTGAAAWLVCAPLVGINLLAEGWLSTKFQPRDYHAYAEAIVQEIPPGERVLGPAILWPYFLERNPFIATNYFIYLTTVRADFTYRLEQVAGELDRLAPDYVIYDGSLDCHYVSTAGSVAYGEYLAAACTPIGEVDDRWFGAGALNIDGQPTLIYHCTR